MLEEIIRMLTAASPAFVERIEGKRVVLIDGETLADLVIQHNIGVTITETYELKSLSGDFFDEDEG